MRRESDPISKIVDKTDLLHKVGVDKVNLDLMYGIPGQKEDALLNTLEAVMKILPDQVTVYETRFNRTSLEHHGINREVQYGQYCLIFDYLTEHGYKSRFGSNTFSLQGDVGVSSYIKGRMTESVPYKGFGPSAQSMTDRGISYEILKNTTQTRYPKDAEWSRRTVYELPPEEIMAKYICIALYSGQFDANTASRLLRNDFRMRFWDELEFLISSGYAEWAGDFLQLTRKGFRFYGAIGSLFWSEKQKQMLLEMND